MKLSICKWLNFIFCSVSFDAALAQGSQKRAAEANQVTNLFDSVSIVIATDLLDSNDKNTAEMICNSLERKLHPETGPLGLGLFLKSECKIGDKIVGQANNQSKWLLEINKRDALIEVQLSQVLGSSLSKQAAIAFPSFQSKQSFVQAFSDPRFTWLLSLGLLDQMPVLSRLNPSLVSSNGRTLQTTSDGFSNEFSSSLRFELIPVSVQFSQTEQLWSISVYKRLLDINSQRNASLFVANAAGRGSNLPNILTLLNLTARQIESQKKLLNRTPVAIESRNESEAATLPNEGTLIEKKAALFWFRSKFAMNALTDKSHSSYFSEVTLGTDSFFLGNLFLGYSLNSSPYFVTYFDKTTQTDQSTQLIFSDHTFGLGIFKSFQVKRGVWLIPTFQSKFLSQSVDRAENDPEGFAFQPLRESNLFAAGLSAAARIKFGDFFTQLTAGFDALVPYFDQYKFLYIELESRYIFFGNNEYSSASQADSKGDASSSAFELSAGPLIRAHYTELKRYFPARKKGTYETPFTEISILDVPLGFAIYVSF